jgi:hypothetical protein
VELGRIEIITEVSMLSTFFCMPCEGHLDAVYHLFAYLSLHHNARVVFDPTYTDEPIGSLFIGMSRRQFLQTHLSQE